MSLLCWTCRWAQSHHEHSRRCSARPVQRWICYNNRINARTIGPEGRQRTGSCEANRTFHEFCSAMARCRFTPAAIWQRARIECNGTAAANGSLILYYRCLPGTHTECFHRVHSEFVVQSMFDILTTRFTLVQVKNNLDNIELASVRGQSNFCRVL